jgi:acryloyl-coenzyme A reductase
MKAVIFYEHGGPEVLRYEDVETPRAGPGTALVRVGATTLNRGPDAMTREGRFGAADFTLPHVGGSDAAGEVVALGAGVDGLHVGDRVLAYSILFCGECDLCAGGAGENSCRNARLFGVDCWGGHAEYAVVPAQNLLALPDAVSFEAAATLPVTYVTAWHGLVTRAAVGHEDTVMVMAAGSGIGAAAIQICRLRGARVLATTGADWKADRAREIGAEVVFDYRDPTWPEQALDVTGGLGVTVLFDNVGGDVWSQSSRCLGRAGRLVCSGATAGHLVELDLRRAYRDQITMFFNAQGTRAELAQLVQLVAAGSISPVIDSRYPLREAAAGHRRLLAGQQFGKVVLVPDSASRGDLQ